MSRLLQLSDGRWAHASGALWLPAPSALLIADLHLGYGWAQRRRGELGPVADASICARLQALFDELAPRTIVFLGDLVHAPNPAPEERRAIAEVLALAAARSAVAIVRGNHDRRFAQDFGCPVLDEWRSPGLLAVHGDRLPPIEHEHLILGHFHPAISLRDAAGAKRRLPVFAFTQHTTILPAFSAFASGSDLKTHWTAQLEAALGGGSVRIAACSGQRVAELPFRRPNIANSSHRPPAAR